MTARSPEITATESEKASITTHTFSRGATASPSISSRVPVDRTAARLLFRPAALAAVGLDALLVWMRGSGVDASAPSAYSPWWARPTLRFLWAPLVDALHVPFFTRAFRPAARLAGVFRNCSSRHADLPAGVD